MLQQQQSVALVLKTQQGDIFQHYNVQNKHLILSIGLAIWRGDTITL